METRVCSKCRTPKSIEEFTREKGGTGGRGRYCGECRKAYGKEYAKRRVLYGIPASELAKAEAAQETCAVCKESKHLYPDYDHAAGVLRRFLCALCLKKVKLLRTLKASGVNLAYIQEYLTQEGMGLSTQSPEYSALACFAQKHDTYYRAKLEEQGRVCAICKKPSEEYHRHNPMVYKQLSLDHNHETGQLRGLLCGNCNRGLGFFYENRTSIENAIKYLTR